MTFQVATGHPPPLVIPQGGAPFLTKNQNCHRAGFHGVLAKPTLHRDFLLMCLMKRRQAGKSIRNPLIKAVSLSACPGVQLVKHKAAAQRMNSHPSQHRLPARPALPEHGAQTHSGCVLATGNNSLLYFHRVCGLVGGRLRLAEWVGKKLSAWQLG